MTRRAAAAGTHGVNLMPLLDVLLCTMGTLIVILGVINRDARFHPAKRMQGKAAEAAAQREQMQQASEDLQLRIQQLATARDKTLADLDLSRKRLAGIEDSSREMQDKLQAIIAAGQQLRASDAGDPQRDQLRAQLAQLNSRRMQLDNDLQRARKNSANRQPGYSVIPIEGMYTTNRRPIYIECRSDAVILQPEGIVFTRQDFLGPDGPSNPLAAALRAAQEYWRSAPRESPSKPNDPYPLLLVRPSGIAAYYDVREAMSSWDAEFGYELVGETWKLDFPTQPEPRLTEMENRAVAEARQQLQWLAQISPELFSHKQSKVQYHVAPGRGGVVRDGGPTLGKDPFAEDPLGGFGLPAKRDSADSVLAGGNRQGGNTTGLNSDTGFASLRGNSALGSSGGGNSTLGPGGFGGNGTGGHANGVPGGDGLGENESRGTVKGGLGTGGNSNDGNSAGSSGSGSGGSQSGGNASPEVANVGPRYAGGGAGTAGFGNSGQNSSNWQNGGSTPGNSRDGTPSEIANGSGSKSEYGGVQLPRSAVDRSLSGGNSDGGQYSSAGGAGNSFRDASSQAGAASGAGMSSSSTGSSTNHSPFQSGSASSDSLSFGGAPTISMDMPPPSTPPQQQQRSASRSMAKNRGENWALPNTHSASVPVQRPIRVECWNDRLVLVPDTRDQQPQVIPLGERTEDAMDSLVGAVRSYTKSWGIAGRSMYWKPQLVLNVNPNAEFRAADLQTLLANSGWEVKRK